MDNRPIGVFDSGLGGLTAIKELLRALPGEDIIYFGDTGRVPYGSRSGEAIERYARQDEEFLLSLGVKYIIAACGTVSAVAPHTGDDLPVPFTGVVKPAAAEAARATRSGRIGVIGTLATVSSNAYKSEIMALDKSLTVYQQACPMFVPLVESGWISKSDQVAKLVAERYLEPLKNEKVDTLILGCTHYPIIADVILEIMGEGVTLINASHAVATVAVKELCEKNLLSGRRSGGNCKFYVSDRTQDFSKTASILLGREISADIERVDIGADGKNKYMNRP